MGSDGVWVTWVKLGSGWAIGGKIRAGGVECELICGILPKEWVFEVEVEKLEMESAELGREW